MSLDEWAGGPAKPKKETKDKPPSAKPAKPVSKKGTKAESKRLKNQTVEPEDEKETTNTDLEELDGNQGSELLANEQEQNEAKGDGKNKESSLKLVGLTTFILSCAKCKKKRTIKATSLRPGHKICKKCGSEMKVKIQE